MSGVLLILPPGLWTVRASMSTAAIWAPKAINGPPVYKPYKLLEVSCTFATRIHAREDVDL